MDHLNPTAYVSPRSNHAPGRPTTAHTSFAHKERYLQTLEEVSAHTAQAGHAWAAAGCSLCAPHLLCSAGEDQDGGQRQ